MRINFVYMKKVSSFLSTLSPKQNRKKSRIDIIKRAFYLGLDETLESLLDGSSKEIVSVSFNGCHACMKSLRSNKISIHEYECIKTLLEYVSFLIEQEHNVDHVRQLQKKIKKKLYG